MEILTLTVYGIYSLLYFHMFSPVIMKLILAVLVLVLVIETQAQWYKVPGQAIGGHLFSF